MNRTPGKVAAIIVNHNNDRDTVECIRQLRGSTYPALSIYLVNNGASRPASEDNRLRAVSDCFIRTSNKGFAAACNRGVKWAMKGGFDYVWLVNNDLQVEADTLSSLVGALGDACAACCSPKIVYSSPGGGVQFAGGLARNDAAYWLPRADFEADTGQYEYLQEVDWASGACMLVSISALRKVGLFDEGYFLYYEDVDWCIRAVNSGWKCLYVGSATVRHKASQSTSRVKCYYHPRAHLLFLAKHYPSLVVPALRRYYHHSLRPHIVSKSWGEVALDLRVYAGFAWRWLSRKVACSNNG